MSKFKKIKERFSPAKPESIRFINYAVTNLCNSRCTTCNIWRTYKPGDSGAGSEALSSELNAKEIRKGFENSKCFGNLKSINLAGGEPFLKKDFVEITKVFHELFPSANFDISSNGLEQGLIIEKLGELVGSGINPSISFSMDGTEKEHDLVRGVEGGYKKTMGTISIVKERFPALNISLSFTIGPKNYGELPKVYQKSKELGASFTTRYAIVNAEFYHNDNMSLKWTLESLQETHEILMQIKKEKNKNANPLVGLLSAEKFFLNNMTKQLGAQKRIFTCFSGTNGFTLDAYGNVKPCYFLEKVLGNIKKQEFDEIWFSENAKKTREFIAARKCNCWTECVTIPSLEKNNLMVIKGNLTDALHP